MKKHSLFTILTCVATFSLQAQYQLFNNGASLYVGDNTTLRINGDFTNTATADFNNNGITTITGSVTNNQTMSAYTGKLIFNNATVQTLGGSAEILTKDLEVNNSAEIILNTRLKVDGDCEFINGIIAAPNSTEPIWFTANASITEAAKNTSHVNGYVVKEGTGSFTYPIGNGIRYQPIEIDASANASGVSVKYNIADAGSAPFTGATPLLYYNKLEYWDIAPLSTATGKVTVFWDDYNNVGIGDIYDLRVAHLSSGEWVNEGAYAVGGSILSGSVTSFDVSSWSPFSLGSMRVTSTLPVNWLHVTGSVSGQKKATIKWAVREQNVLDYQVEKSPNGNSFSGIAKLSSKGDGHNEYSYTDAIALQNTTFYRIKQSDNDGKHSYSPVVKLFDQHSGTLTIYPTPFRDNFTIVSATSQKAELLAVDGKRIMTLQLNAGTNYVTAGNLAKGIYIVVTANEAPRRVIKE